jgi:hypothetical protein
LSDLITNKSIDLDPKYQRRFRWDDRRQSKLIESFLMNVPIPPIFLNEDQYGAYSVIDGKQRLMAIHSFLRGRLRLKGLQVFHDINGRSFDELPSSLQKVIQIRPTVRATIILRQSDPDIKFEVFQRLNTGGVRLNAQEIRNSTYPGPLNDLILELSEITDFHKLLGITNKAKSGIYQEMRDAEFVLRFFTFRELWQTFSGGMKRAMDHYMAANQRPSKALLVELRNDFTSTLEAVAAAFGQSTFRRWQPDKATWRKQVLASLFDAQMFACRGRDAAQLRGKQNEILEAFKNLFKDEPFRTSIDAATNTPSFFKRRIETVGEMIQRVLK